MEITMVKAQACLKAGKTKKSASVADFCESTGYCRKHVTRPIPMDISILIMRYSNFPCR
jgi:hypothetical protein